MLAAGGYVGRQDAAELAASYLFLRRVEHLLQLRNLRRTHTMPEDPEVLRMVGRALRLADAGQAARSGEAAEGATAEGAMAGEPATGERRTRPGGGTAGRPDPAQELLGRWREVASQVQRLHEKLFYRPLLDAVASLPGEAVRLTPQAAEARLEALGYTDPAGADPAHAASAAARLVRRRGRPRCRAAGVPPGQRRPR